MDEIIKIQLFLLAYMFSFMFRIKVRVNPKMILFFKSYSRIVYLHMLQPLSFLVLAMYSSPDSFHIWIKYYL